MNPKVLAAALGAAATTSPRLWGEAARGVGRVGYGAKQLTPQQIIDLIQKGYPQLLSKAALAARAGGDVAGAVGGGANAAQ